MFHGERGGNVPYALPIWSHLIPQQSCKTDGKLSLRDTGSLVDRESPGFPARPPRAPGTTAVGEGAAARPASALTAGSPNDTHYCSPTPIQPFLINRSADIHPFQKPSAVVVEPGPTAEKQASFKRHHCVCVC